MAVSFAVTASASFDFSAVIFGVAVRALFLFAGRWSGVTCLRVGDFIVFNSLITEDLFSITASNNLCKFNNRKYQADVCRFNF